MRKLHGMLNLTKIPKNLITTNKKGEKVIWIDVLENKNGADTYGNTHTVTVYDKGARQTHYLANLKVQEFGQSTQPSANYQYQPKNAVPDPSAGVPTSKVVEDLPEDDDLLPF